MIRSKLVVVASVLMLVFVAGCNREEAVDENIAPTPVAVRKKPKAAPGASPAAGAKAAKTATTKASPGAKPKAAAGATASPERVKQALGKLNGYLPAAVKALQADDLDTAKQYVKGFSDNWKQQSASVKKLSPESFNKINAGVTQVNNLMKASAPDKAKATTALQSLSQAVSEFAKS